MYIGYVTLEDFGRVMKMIMKQGGVDYMLEDIRLFTKGKLFAL